MADMPLDQFMKPCPGGYEIQPADKMSLGTLGASVIWDGKWVAITAGHNVDAVGAPVYQPSWVAKGRSAVHVIGRVAGKSRWVAYRSLTEYLKRREDMLYDFAWMLAVVGETTSTIPGIYKEAVPLRTRAAKLGEEVSWLGKSTGDVQRGRVADDDFWVPYPEDDGSLTALGPCLKIDGATGQRGDCGAAIVAEDGPQVVGVYCFAAQNKNFIVASKIPSSAQELEQRSTEVVGMQRVVDRLAKLKGLGFGTGP
ncbi:hypothetical protein ACFVVX_09345 [Kitasatospora sp. NPDC058170]|uniref:hypothetical protein n=1 Tax=Kitasatospora sp. NPDC058170 TaxID=3346364 RepID=UPI0036DECE66